MAIYHLSIKPISRSDGRSSVAAAAYRAGCKLHDESQGLTHNYTKRHGVEHVEIIAPDRQPVDRQQLWSAAELAEKRKDARTAREFELALPAELDAAQRRALTREFAEHLSDRYGVAVDVAIHAPSKDGDERNYHAHLLCTTRSVSRSEGGQIIMHGKTAIELGNKDRKKAGIEGTTKADIKSIRQYWAKLTNAHLEKSGSTARIDHRSYKDQGINLTPTQHVGLAATSMDRKGRPAERSTEYMEQKAEQASQIIINPTLLVNKLANNQIIISRHDLHQETKRYIKDEAMAAQTLSNIERTGGLIILPGTSQHQQKQQTPTPQIQSLYTTPKGIERAIEIAKATGYERLSELAAAARKHQQPPKGNHHEPRRPRPIDRSTITIIRARREEAGSIAQPDTGIDQGMGAGDSLWRLPELRSDSLEEPREPGEPGPEREDQELQLAALLSDPVGLHDHHIAEQNTQERPAVVLPSGTDGQAETVARHGEPDRPQRDLTAFLAPGPRTGSGDLRLWLDPKNTYQDRDAIKATGQATYDKQERAWYAIDPTNIDELTPWLPEEVQQHLQQHAASGADHTSPDERHAAALAAKGPICISVSDRETHMQILATGQATWDEDQTAWVVTDPNNMDKLAEWLPTEHQAEAQRQAAERAPLYAEQARLEQEQAAREAADAHARRDYEHQAIAAVDQRNELINAAQQRIMSDTKEMLKAAEEKAAAALESLGPRPTIALLSNDRQIDWDTKNAQLQNDLDNSKTAYIDWLNDPYSSTKAREWATGEIDAANPQLANLAKIGEEIIHHEAAETRAQSKNLGQQTQTQSQDRGPRRK